MPKSVPKLTIAQIRQKLAEIETAGKPALVNVGGVCVRWRSPESVQWVARVSVDGRRQSVSLGSYDSMTLKEAREKAAAVQAGGMVSPAREKRMPKADKTVAELWSTFLDDMVANGIWKDARAVEVKSSLGANHVFPYIGDLLPDEVSHQHVAAMLSAAKSKAGQAKSLTIVRQFFEWCLPRGYRTKESLPTDRRVLKTMFKDMSEAGGNMPALPWRDVPRFVVALTAGGIQNIGSAALLFKILTASRSEPIHKADWAEIDADLSLWVCPVEHMKVKRNHDGGKLADFPVPLSEQARAILMLIRGIGRTSGLIFGIGERQRMMSANTLGKRIKDLSAQAERKGEQGFRDNASGAVASAHGFRASFRTWAAETGQNEIAAEYCLAHKDKRDIFDGAYLRPEYLEARALILQAWADYCFSQCPADWCKW